MHTIFEIQVLIATAVYSKYCYDMISNDSDLCNLTHWYSLAQGTVLQHWILKRFTFIHSPLFWSNWYFCSGNTAHKLLFRHIILTDHFNFPLCISLLLTYVGAHEVPLFVVPYPLVIRIPPHHRWSRWNLSQSQQWTSEYRGHRDNGCHLVSTWTVVGFRLDLLHCLFHRGFGDAL